MSSIAPSGQTKLFPVVGDPVDQVRSPACMPPIFAALGCDAMVVPLHEMRPRDPLPIAIDNLQSHQFVACAITKPTMSPLIVEARLRGCRTMTGAGMFDAQAGTLVDFLLGREGARDGQWKNSMSFVS